MFKYHYYFVVMHMSFPLRTEQMSIVYKPPNSVLTMGYGYSLIMSGLLPKML